MPGYPIRGCLRTVAGADLKTQIAAKAAELGFAATGFTCASLPPERLAQLQDFLSHGRHGTMGWMAERVAQRAHPQALWPEALSVISLGFSYAPEGGALDNLARPDVGNISVYARNRDYHDIIKGKLKHLAQFIATCGAGVKVFVDTAPVMEKPLAEQAGLGWQGKHTNLVSRRHGSWLFLGEIYTTLMLDPDAPAHDHCGGCTACQTVCPTQAFPAPYQLDARRCISYLTIEHNGPIPEEFRAAIGNRIYGCDDCLAVCPWNKFAEAGREVKLAAREDLTAPLLAELAQMDDAAFRKRFSGSPVKRIGRKRFVRNVAISIGNSGDVALLPVAAKLAGDDDLVVAEAGRWAEKTLGRPA
ncbi:epoxyqueuosine reductase [Acidocella aminolytica 101 = DSM 11237]|uniref:tRNA epoxyqueuosine(34) reductase QueG n=1 Tax=Acidocella aminolytica TaxID=33998 RepID=UPI000918595D|nr:tRNA epoxyqueuosine(34) reductase QueG [Acidocella aminolytica]SHE97241.1 epoxyqueuosine reductase [Acidocella aminolytica 101 = DSM 11237]